MKPLTLKQVMKSSRKIRQIIFKLAKEHQNIKANLQITNKHFSNNVSIL